MPANTSSVRRTRVLSSQVVTGWVQAEAAAIYPAKAVHYKTVALVGAPLADGQPLGGVDLAPSAFRHGGLKATVRRLQRGFVDYGDAGVHCDSALSVVPKSFEGGCDRELVNNSVVVGAGVEAIYKRVSAAATKSDNFVLTVGGDHSIAAGSIPGILKHRPDLAVVWVDAHGDCNTPSTSPSKNYHGMPLAHILGWFRRPVEGFEWFDEHLHKHGSLPENRVALIALRDVDPEERALLKKSNVHVFTMKDIDRHGIGNIMEMALKQVDPEQQRPLHLSFDIDACDPLIAPGTGTKARGGLLYRESHYICERLADTCRLGSMDIVEINPALDHPKNSEDMHGDDPNIIAKETVRLGIELVASALGKQIL